MIRRKIFGIRFFPAWKFAKNNLSWISDFIGKVLKNSCVFSHLRRQSEWENFIEFYSAEWGNFFI